MHKSFYLFLFFIGTVMILPVSCSKKSTNPAPQGQGGNNNSGGGSGGGSSTGSGGGNTSGPSTGAIFFQATINGTLTEWTDASLNYRLRYSGGGSESPCANGTKQQVTAGFVFETLTQEDQLYITFTGCSDADISDGINSDCDDNFRWLESATPFPVQNSTDENGIYLEFKLPANGQTYVTSGASGTATLYRVEHHGDGSYGSPKYAVGGTFTGELVNQNNPTDVIDIKDGTFRVYLGVCVSGF